MGSQLDREAVGGTGRLRVGLMRKAQDMVGGDTWQVVGEVSLERWWQNQESSGSQLFGTRDWIHGKHALVLPGTSRGASL